MKLSNSSIDFGKCWHQKEGVEYCFCDIQLNHFSLIFLLQYCNRYSIGITYDSLISKKKNVYTFIWITMYTSIFFSYREIILICLCHVYGILWHVLNTLYSSNILLFKIYMSVENKKWMIAKYIRVWT